jgi:hypothetical protein
VLEVVRQKGELELDTLGQRIYTRQAERIVNLRRAVCWQQNDMLATSML